MDYIVIFSSLILHQVSYSLQIFNAARQLSHIEAARTKSTLTVS